MTGKQPLEKLAIKQSGLLRFLLALLKRQPIIGSISCLKGIFIESSVKTQTQNS